MKFLLNLRLNKENMSICDLWKYNHLFHPINIYENYYKLNSFKMNDVAICLDKQGLNLI